MAGKQNRTESNFFLISLSWGYFSTTGSPLNCTLGASLQPAEVWAISLCISSFSVRWNRCKDPCKRFLVKEGSAVQSIPCSATVWRKQFTGTHQGSLGKQSASFHSFKSKRHIDNIHHAIATAELCWQGKFPVAAGIVLSMEWWSQSLLTVGIIQIQSFLDSD